MSVLQGDDVVISGISGLFPGADNVQQFGEKLYNKIDMVTKENRFPHIKHPEFPQHVGAVEGIEHFDCQFFRVSSKQAKYMDPVMGKVLEQSFSALFDAGVNPKTVSSRLGVYMACPQIDSVNYMFSDLKASSFVISGGSKCMLANRLSYWMDGKGPSYGLDCGYTGSMRALEIAYNAMKNDEIECAIVGGCNYCFKPELTLNMKRAGLLCSDGKTKCFDKNGDGFVRSDAVHVYFLQKAKDAKRIYAEVKYVKGKYFASPDGLFTPKRNPGDIEKFLKEFYSEINMSPSEVEYLEANSFGIAEADKNELEAVGNIFANNKSVKIGSIKSNIGNTECASGSSSIIKLCLAYQRGQIPANLHYSEPHTSIPAVKEERIQVVTNNQTFNRTFTAVNNFCYTGNNFHTLLKGHYKPKDKQRYNTTLPRLVLVASRNEEGVNNMLNILESNAIDPEQLALLNNFFKYDITGFTERGFTILDIDGNNSTVSLCRSVEYFSGKTRPVWFLYSGMGSQWAGMGEGLLKIPVFAAAVERCSKILKKKGLNLIDIITNKNSKLLNILKSLMAITAIQIGLTDVLKSIGIVPDNIIGHSVGEIASAYGDGSLTADEAILTSYARAIATYETKFIKGTMAAVGLGYNEVKHLCPAEIEVACHNSSESATIAGPSEAVNVFVKSLTDRGIFAKEVDSYNIAFHSRYINEAGPKMLRLLKEVITDPKPRSSKWLSTCYLPKDWHTSESQYASAEYFAHNLMNSVLLEESARYIPEDALIIEIAPHGLLQAIMKRSHSKCINVSLTKRGETDGAKFFLNTLGKLYQTGLDLDLESLYPKVEFPVSTETPVLSHFVKWGNETHWKFNASIRCAETPIYQELAFSLHDDDFNFLRDNIKDGKYVIPEAMLLVLTWNTLATYEKKMVEKTSVVFENITFHGEISIEADEVARFEITIQKGSSKFEVLYQNKLVADGIIYSIGKSTKQFNDMKFDEDERNITQKDVYTLFRARGHNYGEKFQSITSMNLNRNKAKVIWRDDWITFLDSFLQMKALFENCEGLSRVKFINKVTINTFKHKLCAMNANGAKHYNVYFEKDIETISSGGVFFKDIVLNNVNTKIELEDENLKLPQRITKPHPSACENNGSKSYKLIAYEQNNISSLTWIETPIIHCKTTVQVCFSGLSLKDFDRLSNSDCRSFGMDFSGFDSSGRKVMGLVACGAMASTVEADVDLLWPVPQHWSLLEASTVPLPYAHAFYCLAIRHTLSENTSILVIGAAGALGQAVISIALHKKCIIFATVGNADKKRFLLKLFPELNAAHIGYTYDGTFHAMVVEKTNRQKCCIVINTSSGRIREEAMKCVGDGIYNSAFLDVNDGDQRHNNIFRMGFSNGDQSYKSVDMSTIFKNDLTKYKEALFDMISKGIAKGYVRPLTSVVYSPWDVSKAFKLLSQRSNRGRTIINVKKINLCQQLVEIPRMMQLYPTQTYVVICDGTELGIELINLLTLRGANKITMYCNPNTINGYMLAKIAMWRNCGINLELNYDDLRIKDNCRKIMDEANNSIDGLFVTWSQHEKFDHKHIQVSKDIVQIVSNLDIESRDCKYLRYFAIVIATQTCENGSGLKDLEDCSYRRKHHRLPSLYLHHKLGDKDWDWDSKTLSILFSKLEKSLVSNLTSTSISSENNKVTNNTEKINTKFDAGLSTFYRHILSEELEAVEPIVQLKTKFCPNIEKELTIDPANEYIIMIPGFDGDAKCLASIAERLEKPALALQMGVDAYDNISDISTKLLHFVKKRYHFKSPFHLFGYSWGVNIALEMAAILEKEGLVGVVYCLDSSPDALRVHLDAYLGEMSEEKIQDALIEHMYRLFCGRLCAELSSNLRKAATWTEKVKVFVNEAKLQVTYSHEFLRNYLESTYNRIKLAKLYKPKFTLNSQIVLIKGVTHPNALSLSNDYDLSSYTKKHVQVFHIKSDHAMALTDCRVSNYLSRTLKNKYIK